MALGSLLSSALCVLSLLATFFLGRETLGLRNLAVEDQELLEASPSSSEAIEDLTHAGAGSKPDVLIMEGMTTEYSTSWSPATSSEGTQRQRAAAEPENSEDASASEELLVEANEDYGADKKSAKGSYLALLKDKHILAIVGCYGLLSGGQIFSDEIFTLFAQAPVADHGLGWDSAEIGLALGISGIALLLFQLFGYPRIGAQFSFLPGPSCLLTLQGGAWDPRVPWSSALC